MAYADQKQPKAVAIGSVVLVHAALGAALVSGLVVRFAPIEKKEFITEHVPLPTPPEPLEPPPPVEKAVEPKQTLTTINVPKPIVPTESELAIETTTVITPVLPPIPGPVTPEPAPPSVEPPTPPAVNLSRLVKPRGNVGDWFPHDSYPPAARRAGAEGRVSVALSVGADGRVTGCDVTASSGNGDLDTATCRLATRNGRFAPALNAQGQAVATTVTLPPVRWRLEE